MKKKLLLFILLGVSVFILLGVYVLVNAQDVKVDINHNDVSSKKDCSFEINGICSTEDVGGVDVQFFYQEAENATFLSLINYNSKPVTTIYRIGNNCSDFGDYSAEYKADGSVGTTFLKPKEMKWIEISRYNGTRCYYISGLISRFLK